jgi:hypothetical protein
MKYIDDDVVIIEVDSEGKRVVVSNNWVGLFNVIVELEMNMWIGRIR